MAHLSRRVFGATVSMALLATACGGSDDDAVTGSSVAVTTTVEVDVEGAVESTSPTTTTPAPPTTTPATSSTGAGEPVDRDFSAIGPVVSAFVDERGLNGAGLVIVHGEDGVLHEEYWGEFSPTRVSFIASSSKMISAAVLLRLQDDGVLDIDAPIADYVDWGDANPDITTAQLLSNSSGLIGLLQNMSYPPYLCQWSTEGTLQGCGETIFTTPDDDGDILAPDTEFHYGGGQWQVAGAVAEAVSGRSWSQLLEEIFIDPCGVDSLGYAAPGSEVGLGFELGTYTPVDTENPNIEGGGYITAPDYADLLLMHLRDGRCGETQVVSPEALDTMRSDRVAEVYSGDAYSPGLGYGMGWWIERDSDHMYDGGAFGSQAWLDLPDDYGVFLVIERDSGTGQELRGQVRDIIDAAVNGEG